MQTNKHFLKGILDKDGSILEFECTLRSGLKQNLTIYHLLLRIKYSIKLIRIQHKGH